MDLLSEKSFFQGDLKFREKIKKYIVNLKRLDRTQSASLAVLLFILLSLPLTVMLANRQTYFKPRAQVPTTPPITSPTSPTPTIVGSLPVITTNLLPDGYVNKMYNFRIEGYDPDKNDTLSMSAENLPLGLSLIRCKNTLKPINAIKCELSGKPSIQGQFSLVVNLSDNNGNKTYKEFTLNIFR